MATTIYPTVPVAQPEAEAWPLNDIGGDDPTSIQADEMFARQLDTGFAGDVRNLLHDPATGLAAKGAEEALGGIADALPMLGELKDRYLAQAIGPRQRAVLEPLIDTRLDRATGDLGRIAQQATSELDDRIVTERLAGLQQDAALAWHDPAQLRVLGRAAVNELRYQGERKGWEDSQTDTTVRQGLSDLYAGAIEQAIGQDPDRAAKLYDHARDVMQPERQAAVERKIERAREERRVSDVVAGLADTPDDPTRRPDLEDYQARAAELAPPDASPEVRAQVARMAWIEHARADRAWQAARGRAAMGALDWLGKNPAAPLLAMPTELRDGLSPKQTEQLDAAAINGGRVVTDRDLYESLDDQAVGEPENFAGIDLAQYRLSLGDSDFKRLTEIQSALAEGKSDPTFERHSLGRLFLGEGLRNANVDPDGPQARTSRQQLDRLLGAFEAVEGRLPAMADIRGIVGGVLRQLADDPNLVRVGEDGPTGADRDTQVAQQQELAKARRGTAPLTEPVPGSPEYEAARHLVPVVGQRGIAPNVEPVPGSPEFQAAMAKTATGSNEGKIVILPNGRSVPSEDSKTGFLMSPVAELSEVAAAGRELFWKVLMNPGKMMEYGRELVRKDLAQGGRFDYQRLWIPDKDVPDYLQLRQFRDVSNFNVGLYLQQANFPLYKVLEIAGDYAKKYSSNYMSNEDYGLDPRVRRWIERGYAAGASGAFTLAVPGGPSRPK